MNNATGVFTAPKAGGDRIDVWKSKGKVHDVIQRSNHFTGWLLEEHLE